MTSLSFAFEAVGEEWDVFVQSLMEWSVKDEVNPNRFLCSDWNGQKTSPSSEAIVGEISTGPWSLKRRAFRPQALRWSPPSPLPRSAWVVQLLLSEDRSQRDYRLDSPPG